MNLNSNPTSAQLRELVRQCDDAAGHHILWVSKSGDVEISRIARDQVGFEDTHADLQLRFETFVAGNEYVGPDAASDDDWISELFENLKGEWEKARGKPETAYVNTF
jgi:hypothetical protein